MDALTFEPIDVIAAHSAALAAVSRDNLDATVAHCPGWDVADLVHHMTDVFWFWGTMVDERLTERPADSRRPAPAPRDERVDRFTDCASWFIGVLTDADSATPIWTWAPKQQNAGFVIRHQVQEAVVHHWDAANAAGQSITVDPAAAADSVEEFLTFSVYDGSYPMDPPPVALDGAIGLACSDIDMRWTAHDAVTPGLVSFSRGISDGVPTITASAGDLLLWLYDRVELNTAAVPADLVGRFRALSFTD
jgi:uncharacterized protein (TIGR03083 family)